MPVNTRQELTADVHVHRTHSVMVRGENPNAWLEIQNRDGPPVCVFLDYHIAASMAAAYWDAVAMQAREAGL